MTSRRLRFADVSLTDGQTTVWSGAVTTGMMMKAMAALAGSGLSTIEVISNATIEQCLVHGEDPWQRIELMRQQNPTVPFRASISLLTSHGCRGADVISTDVARLWIKALAKRDISQIVIIDPLLRVELLAPLYEAATENALIPIAVLPFVEDDTLSDEVLARQAASLIKAGAARLMLRDEAGVLTPDRVASLIPHLVDVLGDVPLLLHSRCTTALGPLVSIEAIKLGVSELDTALPVLANGASLPSSITLAKSLDIVKVEAKIPELASLEDANSVLVDIAEREGFNKSVPWVFDLAPFSHQLPGDIAASAMDQLKAAGQWHLLHAFSNECARIRKEIGSPPMLAPFALGIAEQAFANLEDERRYARIHPIIRRSLQSVYGDTAGEVDTRLLEWVGALGDRSGISSGDGVTSSPSSSEEAVIIEQLTGISPQDQPEPAAIEALDYVMATPQEVLEKGLSEYSDQFAFIRFNGPDIDVQVSAAGGQ